MGRTELEDYLAVAFTSRYAEWERLSKQSLADKAALEALIAGGHEDVTKCEAAAGACTCGHHKPLRTSLGAPPSKMGKALASSICGTIEKLEANGATKYFGHIADYNRLDIELYIGSQDASGAIFSKSPSEKRVFIAKTILGESLRKTSDIELSEPLITCVAMLIPGLAFSSDAATYAQAKEIVTGRIDIAETLIGGDLPGDVIRSAAESMSRHLGEVLDSITKRKKQPAAFHERWAATELRAAVAAWCKKNKLDAPGNDSSLLKHVHTAWWAKHAPSIEKDARKRHPKMVEHSHAAMTSLIYAARNESDPQTHLNIYNTELVAPEGIDPALLREGRRLLKTMYGVRIVRALSREHQIRTNGPNENGVLTFNSYAEMSRFFGYDGTDKYGSEIANVMRYLGEIEIEAADIVAQGNKTKSKAGTVIWFEEPVKSRGGRPSGASRGILIRTNSLIWSTHSDPTRPGRFLIPMPDDKYLHPVGSPNTHANQYWFLANIVAAMCKSDYAHLHETGFAKLSATDIKLAADASDAGKKYQLYITNWIKEGVLVQNKTGDGYKLGDNQHRCWDVVVEKAEIQANGRARGLRSVEAKRGLTRGKTQP